MTRGLPLWGFVAVVVAYLAIVQGGGRLLGEGGGFETAEDMLRGSVIPIAVSAVFAVLVHASQDFVILSGRVGTDAEESPASVLVIVAMAGLAVLVWRRHRRIEPASAPARSGGRGSR